MEKGFYFWFSIISLAINVILIMFGVGLLVANRKERERRNAQVKIWMQGANGVQEALQRIIQDKWNNLYSSVQDVVNTINAVHSSAFAVYQSLYEERALTEDEWKKEQAELRDRIRNPNQQQNSPEEPNDLPASPPPATIPKKRVRRMLGMAFKKRKK